MCLLGCLIWCLTGVCVCAKQKQSNCARLAVPNFLCYSLLRHRHSPNCTTGVSPEQFQSSGDAARALGVLSQVTQVPAANIGITYTPTAAAAPQPGQPSTIPAAGGGSGACKLLQQVRLMFVCWVCHTVCVESVLEFGVCCSSAACMSHRGQDWQLQEEQFERTA